ncbi:LacI family transcriptional regulator [Gelidibacter algens]|uniref:LacI family transcriptional regulator n=1 Tax=Gelidibacter algens TaxID=49280 RepID=A0A1A7R5Y5_9FLAO|nr:LacI family DNA-binding transcriptional regulator [Gelidibacter algens]OBX26913.1 LacI family transcriptional regulator [Gelidibacter algens]RAJ26464.1 LacI family transcriptional regulator [Gelidibacter algens]
MVTLKQLAEQLNVSVSTVSKALNNSEEISKDTIERVKELAKHLNYQPNKMALSLKSNKTKTLGVIIPNILNHFFAKALYAIEMEASKQGYNIITCVSNEMLSKEENSLQLLSNGSVDGFIMSIAEETQVKNKTDHIAVILNQGIPMVLFDRVVDLDCDKVIIDDFGASYEATKHLLSEGRKHIVLISEIEELSVGKLRTNGYLKALEEDTTSQQEPIVIHVGKDDDLEETIDNLFISNSKVDGILSIDNTSGVVALHKALRRGYKVPENLSIIGFSDDNVLAYTDPKLSTISQHTFDIGKSSVKLMIDRLQKKSTTTHVTKTIKTNLILRGTTK